MSGYEWQQHEEAIHEAARYERELEAEHLEHAADEHAERMARHADFKQPRRHVANAGEWHEITRSKLAPCRGCGSWDVTLHHLVPRSLRGDDVPDNIIPLCGHGTTGCHGALENHPAGWEEIAAKVRASLTTSEIVYVAAKKDRNFLDRYLPA